MLKLNNITKTYKMGENTLQALKGVSLTIESGEFAAIIGASGSGKSTMMNIIGLLDRPSTGEYLLNNQPVMNLDHKQRVMMRNLHIGFVFQSFFLLPRLTALQNVGLPLQYRGLDKKTIEEKSLRMLEKVGMEKHQHHKPAELSGGQQQRVAIARALVGSPSIILADEPTGALDSKTSQDVMNLFTQINKEENATILIITHDMNVANQCARVIRIQDGEIL